MYNKIYYYFLETLKSLTMILISFLILSIKVSNDINPYKVDRFMDIYYILCGVLLLVTLIFVIRGIIKRKYATIIYLLFLFYSIYAFLNPKF